MAHVQAVQIAHSFGARDVLRSVTFPIGPGTRTALSGDNGSGKTTLLKIIAGLIPSDSGTVVRQKNTVISYLPQSGVVHSGSPLLLECEGAFDRFSALLAEKSDIEHRLTELKEGDSSIDQNLHRQHEIEETLMDASYDRRGEQIQRVLSGLGFLPADYDRDTAEFSGGWQMRIALAKVLLEKPDVLLLDEPTNYLDIEARDWLERFLVEYRGGVVIVSHDRYFLDVTVNAVAELYNATLRIYPGNYTAYKERRAVELKTLLASYRKQQDEIAKLEDFIRRFRYNSSKAAQVQSRITLLQKMQVIEIPESLKRIHFAFPKSPHSGKLVLRARELSRSYGELEALRGVTFELERGDKLVIAGVNGAGKSTLMRIVSGRDTEYDGELHLGTDVKPGYFSQEIDELDEKASVLEEAEASAPTSLIPTLRNLLGTFLFRGDDIHKRVSVLSGGERNRLALLKLLLHPVNLLILDEPTNHLDMTSKQVLLDALESFDGTLLFVSHDRYFIEELANRVLELRSGSSRLFAGDYKYYLWKTEQAAGQTAETGNTVAIPKDLALSAGRKDHREQKRTKGEIRRLEREEHALMERLETLEQAHSRIISEMADPAVYTDGKKVRLLKAAIAENEAEQTLLSGQWHELETMRSRLEKTGP
jgi:ATP-binding cassette, subfamily F, member 3